MPQATTSPGLPDAPVNFEQIVRTRKRGIRRAKIVAAAVIVTLIALLGIYAWYWDFAYRVKYRTGANVSFLIDLPDGTSARLGPSSRLVHWKDMVVQHGNMQRDVELQGSAEFIVKPDDGPRQFSMRTRHVDVKPVKATRFRVEEHEGFTRVFVEEGGPVLILPLPIDPSIDPPRMPEFLNAGQRVRVFGGHIIPDK